MPSNPFNLDRALDELRSEQPAPGAADRARSALLKPNRPSWRPRVLVATVGAVAVAALLWPRPGSGVAWAQVASATRGQERMHMAMYTPGQPKPYLEKWVDGSRYCMWSDLKLKGKPDLVYYSVCDGNRTLRSMGPKLLKNGEMRTAHLEDLKPYTYSDRYTYGILGANSNLIDDVIKQESWNVTDQKDGQETSYGPRDVYRLQISYDNGYSWHVVVYVDHETRLLREIESFDEHGKMKALSKIEYPKEIPDSRFALVDPFGCKIVDMDKATAELAATIKKGLGTKRVAGKTIVLRAVVHDGTGGLWVFWTGSAPAGDLRYPIQVEGLKGQAFGIKAFTVTPDARSKPAPAIGQRLGGMAISVPGKRLDRITVTVPVLDATGKKKLGAATFKNVPVFHIDMIYDFAKTLGIN